MSYLAVYLTVGFLAAAHGQDVCPLEGKWKSDLELSLGFSQANNRLCPGREEELRQIFGSLRIQFLDGKATLTMPNIMLGPDQFVQGFREESNFEPLFCSAQEAVVLRKDPKSGRPSVMTYNFTESGVIWTYRAVWHQREYFRRETGE